MTREEAVTVLKELMKNPLFSEVHKVAFNIAIHDIKQRHEWDINNLILINKDNHESLKQEPRKDEVILTKEEYGELVSSEFDNGYAKGYREALEQEPILDKVKQAREEIENLNLNDYGDNLYQFQAKCTEILDKLIGSEE